MFKSNWWNLQLPESLFFPLVMIKISVIFHDEEFVIVTFSDVVIVFKVRETLADLLFGVQPVQPVIGLYPQYVLFGFHDMVDQISRKQCF